jgi:hypothetical protein
MRTIPAGRFMDGRRHKGVTMAKLVLPRVHVRALCDEIEPSSTDEQAFDLRGVRTAIAAPAFPYRHPQLCVYLQATGHEGAASCSLQVVNAETDNAVAATAARTVEFRGPLVFVPVCWWLQNCWFPGPALYYVQVLFDGKLLAERALFLTQGETTDHNGQPSG